MTQHSQRFQPSTVLPATWGVLRSPPQDGATNMALDLALLDHARGTGKGVLRCYDWSRPTISFGRNETVKDRFNAGRIAAAGFDAVRRPTGGRALLHSREVTYSAVMPLGADSSWRDAYDAVNMILCSALRSLGIEARIVGDREHAGKPLAPSEALCFAAPSAGEIAVGSSKLVGSSVWRERDAFLQHGSILISDDQARLQELVGDDSPELPSAATLETIAGHAEWAQVATALEQSLSDQADTAPLHLDAEIQRAAELRVNTFRDPSWLWRR